MKSLILLSFVGCLASACPLVSKSTTSNNTTDTPTSAIASTTTGTATATPCRLTATPIASLCGYSEPLDAWNNAIAASGPDSCWEICSNSPTCNFMIYRQAFEGPHISGPGTCWAYPGLKYSPAKAEKCTGDKTPNLFVYGTPACAPPCYPSASTLVDEICDYVQPQNPDKNVIVAQGPETCWKACGDDPDCTYTIFKKGREILGVVQPSYCYIFNTGEIYHVGMGTICPGSRSGPSMSVYTKDCDGTTA
ncbi:hypothetical protein AA313_de0209050 [Arthrobotrys entomopaga]|nr:hypothetical protein AA313_de0209050 [Arthrobotrys entomopaga]